MTKISNAYSIVLLVKSQVGSMFQLIKKERNSVTYDNMMVWIFLILIKCIFYNKIKFSIYFFSKSKSNQPKIIRQKRCDLLWEIVFFWIIF